MIPPPTGPFGVSYIDQRIICKSKSEDLEGPSSAFFRIYYPSSLHRNKWQKLAKDTSILGNWVPASDYYDGNYLPTCQVKDVSILMINYFLDRL